jgi:hypothetical protein
MPRLRRHLRQAFIGAHVPRVRGERLRKRVTRSGFVVLVKLHTAQLKPRRRKLGIDFDRFLEKALGVVPLAFPFQIPSFFKFFTSSLGRGGACDTDGRAFRLVEPVENDFPNVSALKAGHDPVELKRVGGNSRQDHSQLAISPLVLIIEEGLGLGSRGRDVTDAHAHVRAGGKLNAEFTVGVAVALDALVVSTDGLNGRRFRQCSPILEK